MLSETQMDVLERHRMNLKNKWDWLSSNYDDLIDDLLEELEKATYINNIPNHLYLTQFTFLEEWAEGIISTQDVIDKLDAMTDFEIVAKTKLMRKLYNYIDTESLEVANIVKPYLSKINDEFIKEFEQYLLNIRVWFVKMSVIEDNQIPITWMTQDFDNSEVKTKLEEFTFNQIYKYMKTEYKEDSDWITRSWAKNYLVIDEALNDNRCQRHWILGPKNYIKLLAAKLKIPANTSDEDDNQHLKKLINGYVK